MAPATRCSSSARKSTASRVPTPRCSSPARAASARSSSRGRSTRSSPRAERAFVAVNCAGLPETLLESELFGHVKGSFTGAYRDKPGKLEIADEGTIFLDEVGEMTLRMQGLLLRFLETGELQKVGSDAPAAASTCGSLPRPIAICRI